MNQIKKMFFFILSASIFMLGVVYDAKSCGKVKGKPIQYYINYEGDTEHKEGFFDYFSSSTGSSDSFDVGDCNKSNGKFIVLQMSPVYTDMVFSELGSAYGEINQDGCYIENSPFKFKDLNDSGFADFFKKQRKLITTCMQTTVTDSSGDIKFPEQQFDCSVKKISRNQVLMRGGNCYVKVGRDSTFKYKIDVNPDCTKREFLKQNEISPMDIKVLYNVFISSNASGHDVNMQYLGVIDGRVALLAGKELLPIASYMGTGFPNWPIVAGAQVDLAEVSIVSKDSNTSNNNNTGNNNTSNNNNKMARQGYVLKMPFVVSNTSFQACKDGICTSPSYFKFPAVAEVTLKKRISDQQYKVVDKWYQGVILNPGFLGVVNLERRIPFDLITIGDVYILEAKFSDIAMSYQLYKDGMKQMLIALESYSATGSVDIGEIGELGQLGTIGDFSHDLPDLPDIIIGGTNEMNAEMIKKMLESLRLLLDLSNSWPPYYSKICETSGKCVAANKEFNRIKIKFIVEGFFEDREKGLFVAKMGNLKKRQDSELFGSYEKSFTKEEWPRIQCQ
ncbi:MAG: hypothetical protein HQK49_11410 [Oligoflexia bacterium]|nr:hypothetical protein [Oligoflexia bacterium]